MAQANTDSPNNNWVLYRSVAYLLGKGIHYGSAAGRIFPKRAFDTNKFCVGIDPRRGADADSEIVSDNLDSVTDRFFDWVFVDQVITEHKDPLSFFRQVTKKLKGKGHLLVVVPQEKDKIEEFVGKVGSWIRKDEQLRNGLVFRAYKFVPGGKKGITIPVREDERPKACVVRYGAFGDLVMITPVVRKLSEDGYHVTVNMQVSSASVLAGNPFIDNVVLQERDAVFNPDLGNYWKEWEGEYDKYVNLCESIEGTLLKVENRRDFYTPTEWRHEQCNKNYWDHTMEKAGFPELKGERGELFFHKKETKDLEKLRKIFHDKFMIAWLVKGSAAHKMYAFMEPVVRKWLEDHPDSVVWLLGDQRDKPLGFEGERIENVIGRWPIRSSMLFTKYADLVVGPETGVMAAASTFDTPKMVFLSHSSEENLTKYWTNTRVMTPDTKVAPCYGKSGCHQMHYTLDSCLTGTLHNASNDNQVADRMPMCTMAVQPGKVMQGLQQFYDSWKQARVMK